MTVFGETCPCGTNRVLMGQVWVCPHCDRPPLTCGAGCQPCRRYAAWQGRSRYG